MKFRKSQNVESLPITQKYAPTALLILKSHCGKIPHIISNFEVIKPNFEAINNENEAINSTEEGEIERQSSKQKEGVLDDLSISKLSGITIEVLEYIKRNPNKRTYDIASSVCRAPKTVATHIQILIKHKLIEHIGSNKTGGYFAIEKKSED